MSAILGVWNRTGQPLDLNVLEAMSAALTHRGRDGSGQEVSAAVGFACQHLWVTPEEVGERQPLLGRDGRMIVFDGRIDNRAELLPTLDLPPQASDAACVLAGYERWGPAVAERLNGDFAFAISDPTTRRLLLVRDAIGVRPLHYHVAPGLFAFATEVKALLRHPAIPARPSDEGLADYLLLGQRPADRWDVTCFEGIFSVPPAHLLEVTPHRLTCLRYWDFDPAHQMRFAAFEGYAEALRDRFGAAVQRRVRSAYPVAISVSGGLDSSAILCQAEHLRRSGTASYPSLVAISYSGAEGTTADERSFLVEMERAYQLEIDRVPMVPLLGLVDGVDLQVRHAEVPLLDLLWPVTHCVEQRAAARGARRFLTGHWGDQMLFAWAYYADLFRRLAWGEMRRHSAELGKWFLPDEASAIRRHIAQRIVREHVPRVILPLLKRLRRRLGVGIARRPWLAPAFAQRALAGANQPATIGRGFSTAQARSLYREARITYHVQSMEWNNKVAAFHGLDHAFPYLDRDLISFLLATPGEIHNRNGVPRALFREAMAGILPDPIRYRAWKGDFTRPANEGVQRDLAALRRMFSSAPRVVRFRYADPGRLRAELAGLESRLAREDCHASWEMADLLGLETWLRLFFDRRAPHPDL